MNNTLKYVKVLESTGITREQAEAHVQLITEITEGDLATKQDMRNLETKYGTSMEHLDHKMGSSIERLEHKIDTSIERLENKLDKSIERLEHKLDTSVTGLEHKMLQMEYRLTIKLGTIVTIAIAAATTVIKLL